MAENGANGNNGNAGRDGRDADPTALTTDALEREILHLRELIEARLDNMDRTAIATQLSNQKALDAASLSSATAISAAQTAATTAINAAQVASDKAVEAALAASDKAILELDGSIARRISAVVELTESKFITYQTLLDSQSQKVALALDSSEKAVAKAEQFNNKQFETMSDKIDDLKKYQFSTVGNAQGKSQNWGVIIAGVGLVATILGIIIVLANVLTSQ